MALKLWLGGPEAPLVAQAGKNPPAVQETRARALGGEDLLEEETATHSGILAWRIPRTEEPGRLQSMGRKESHTTWRLINNKEASSESIQQSTETRVQDWVPKEARDRWVGPFSWQFHCI